jgi:hypothetical protein
MNPGAQPLDDLVMILLPWKVPGLLRISVHAVELVDPRVIRPGR